MTSPTPPRRLVYDDHASPAQMLADCRAASVALGLPGPGERRLERAARRAVTPPPSLDYADYPREVPKRDVTISAAASRLAGALHLHLD